MMLAEGKIVAEHYQLLKHLGSGSFGDVWLAHNMLADIDVAIKFYGAFDEKGLSEFRNEFKVAYKLNHPNLLNISHFDVYENCPYLVMPYCANGSVGNHIGRMHEAEVWKFVRDVASGLAFLHSQQPAIIHQDIKPDNILITSDGRYVISDFGISRNLRTQMSRTMNNQNSSGTLAYMGPERFSEHPLVVLASDVWAFGMTLYEVITGHVLWEGMGGCVQLNGAKIPAVRGVSSQLERLVCACLAAETWNRPTASQIVDYATAYLQHKPLPPIGNGVSGNTSNTQIYPGRGGNGRPGGSEPITPKPDERKPENNSRNFIGKRIALIAAACLAAIVLVSGIVYFVNYISEEQDFVSCKTKQDYEQFIKDYPSSSRVEDAQKRIKALSPAAPLMAIPVSKSQKPASVKVTPTKPQPADVEIVMRPQPSKEKPVQPAIDANTNQPVPQQPVQTDDGANDDRMFYGCTTLNDYYAYLNIYPNGRHRVEANNMIQSLSSTGSSIVNAQEPESQPIRPVNAQNYPQSSSRSSSSVNINVNSFSGRSVSGGHRSSSPRRSSGPVRSTAPARRK